MKAIFTCLQIFQSVSFYSDELPFVKAFFFDSLLCHEKFSQNIDVRVKKAKADI